VSLNIGSRWDSFTCEVVSVARSALCSRKDEPSEGCRRTFQNQQLFDETSEGCQRIFKKVLANLPNPMGHQGPMGSMATPWSHWPPHGPRGPLNV